MLLLRVKSQLAEAGGGHVCTTLPLLVPFPNRKWLQEVRMGLDRLQKFIQPPITEKSHSFQHVDVNKTRLREIIQEAACLQKTDSESLFWTFDLLLASFLLFIRNGLFTF